MQYKIIDDLLSEELIQEILVDAKKKRLNEGKVGNHVNHKQKIRKHSKGSEHIVKA